MLVSNWFQPWTTRSATADEVTAFEGRNKDAERVSDRNTEIVHWHKDSHPFVCVVMLSDARYMNGGETELETGIEGKTLKVKAPQMVSERILHMTDFPISKSRSNSRLLRGQPSSCRADTSST